MSFALFLMASAAGPASAVVYWLGFSWQPASPAKTWTKALPMGILFAWLWVFAEDVGDSPIPWAVFFAWLGDIALSKDGDRWFLAGMASFGLAHLFLIGVFWDLGLSFAAIRWSGVAVLATVACGLVPLMWRNAGGLRGPVMAYVIVILAMGLCGLAITSGDARVDQTILLGLALFIVSDAVLAVQVFIAHRVRSIQIPLSLLVWPTYYLAMVCFAAAAPG